MDMGVNKPGDGVFSVVTESIPWSDYENSDPVADIAQAARGRNDGALMLLSTGAWSILRKHPVVIDMCRCLARDSCEAECPFAGGRDAEPRPIMVTRELVASALDLSALISVTGLQPSCIVLLPDSDCLVMERVDSLQTATKRILSSERGKRNTRVRDLAESAHLHLEAAWRELDKASIDLLELVGGEFWEEDYG